LAADIGVIMTGAVGIIGIVGGVMQRRGDRQHDLQLRLVDATAAQSTEIRAAREAVYVEALAESELVLRAVRHVLEPERFPLPDQLGDMSLSVIARINAWAPYEVQSEYRNLQIMARLFLEEYASEQTSAAVVRDWATDLEDTAFRLERAIRQDLGVE
jgi:hypothetical protein